MSNRERIAVFIDGVNLYATAKALAFDIDYKRLLRHFEQQGQLVRAYYYTVLTEDDAYVTVHIPRPFRRRASRGSWAA